MEEFQINESNDSDGDLGFINRSDFINNDLVLFESPDRLLSTIDPMGLCHDSLSFLNPVNDILNDLNEFSKYFCCEPVGGLNSSLPSIQSDSQIKFSWPIQQNEQTLTAPFGNQSDAPKVSTEVDHKNCNITAVNNDSVLLPDVSVECPASNCTLGGEYSSAINQWFQSLEQQQISFITAPVSAIPLTPSQGYSDTLLKKIGSLPSSTTITPITMMDEHQLVHGTNTSLQQDVTSEALFMQERSGISASRAVIQQVNMLNQNIDSVINHGQEEVSKPKLIFNVEQTDWKQVSHIPATNDFLQLSEHSNKLVPFSGKLLQRTLPPARQTPTIGFQKNRLHWSTVFPRKQFIQPPEMIIMHPLRTRKFVAARHSISTCNTNCTATINLCEYFDTRSIEIPMIRERSSSVVKNGNRRKQKLHTIPGAENLIFEIQMNEWNRSNECVYISSAPAHSNGDPYPETELPELDEIFKRKKKSAFVSAAGQKRTYTISQSFGPGVLQKRQCLSSSTHHSLPHAVQEFSTSFEEKISVSTAIGQNRSNKSMDKNEKLFNSESDTAESDDDKNKTSELGCKSLKCRKCRKLFKTTRSLGIHTKSCTAIPSQLPQEIIELGESDTNKNIDKQSTFKTNTLQNTFTKYHSEKSSKSLRESSNDDNINFKISETNVEINARPITRSQTRRSTGRSVLMASSTKKSK